MTGDILFNDGVKAKFGASNDLQIWHNGSDSYIYDTGEGDLILRGSSNIKLQSSSGTALSTFTAAGASTLYFSAAEKLATTSSGIDVTGKIAVGDANTVADHELHIQSSSPTIRLEDTDGNKRFDITQSGDDTNFDFESNVIYKKADGTEVARIDTSGIDVTGKIQVTSTDPEIFLTDTSTGVDHSIDGNSGVGNLFVHVDKNNEGSDPKFIVNVGAADNLIVATEAGNVGVGHTSPVAKMAILGSSNSTITEANSNLCVEGGGGNGMLFGTLSTTGFKSYIQSGFVSNLGTATYDLLLNPEGGDVGVGLSAPTAKMHLFTDGIDQSMFSAQADLGVLTTEY